jgi:enoyl-CoA hydratase
MPKVAELTDRVNQLTDAFTRTRAHRLGRVARIAGRCFMSIDSRDEVIVERRDHVLWAVLSRPSAFNAITPRSIDELDHILDRVQEDRSIRSLVITGSGKAFCAGADLKAVLAASAEVCETAATSCFLGRVGVVFNRLEALPIPTIAALNGTTLAGGLELMLCCDMAIASADVRIGDGHANFGQIPGGGGTLRLPRRIGAWRAKQLMFTGATISATQACAWGLVDEVAHDDLGARVQALTDQIATKSSLVLERMKGLVDGASHLSSIEALEAELRASDLHMTSRDRNEGLAAFAEKRTPRYLGL